MAYYSPASNKSFPPQNLAASSSSIIINNSPGHQQLPVVVKEKSPQKRTPNRSRGDQTQRKLSALSPSDASSSEALASTIASVASGGGSLEEFEKFSAATSLGSSSNSPSSLFTNSLSVHPGPSSFSEQLSASQNITQAPASTKRRKNCGGISALNSIQSNQKINQLLLAGFPDSPSNSPIGTFVDRNKKIGALSTPQFHHIQEVQQQQCRIHVQNPPQTHGDFPVTGTKIQVVHMQPSPAAAASLSTGACESPQQQPRFSPLQQQQYISIGTMLPPPRSQQNEMIIPNHYHHNQHQIQHHSLPATPFSSTGLDFYGSGVSGTGGVVSGDMMLSSSATATPSPAAAISLSPAASMMPPTPGCVVGSKSVQNMQKFQQKHRATYHQHQKPMLDNGNGPISMGCNSSNSYPPPSTPQQQSYSTTMSAQASPQPPQHQFILQKKIEKNSCGNGGNSNVASLLAMQSSSSYSQQQIRQNHHQQYSPMSVPIQSVNSADASSVPSPQILHRFHQNTPHQQLHSSPPQILSVGPHLQQQNESVCLHPQAPFGGQNLNQQALFASQQASLPGQQQLQPPIYHKHLQHQIPFHNQTHQQPQQLPLHYLQTQPPPTPPQQHLRSHQQQYLHLESTTMPIERPTAPLPTQQHMHPPPSPMFSSIKQQHNSNIGNQHVSSVPQSHSIYLSQQQQSSHVHLKQQQQIPNSPILNQQQPIVLQKHHMQQHTFQQQQQPIILSPPPPPYVANAYSSQQPPPQQMRMFPTAAPSPFVCPVTPTGPLNIAGCSSSTQMLPPMPQPARAQLSRAQLLTRHSRELKCHKYAIKLYHLQRTTKALVYKNGALADELTRLHQQIQTVTEERRVLAKRLQHHERNRIRRLQTHFRKAAAAAAAAEAAAEKKNEEEANTTTTSTSTTCKKLVFCTLLNSKQKKHTTAQLNCKDSHIHTDKVSL